METYPNEGPQFLFTYIDDDGYQDEGILSRHLTNPALSISSPAKAILKENIDGFLMERFGHQILETDSPLQEQPFWKMNQMYTSLNQMHIMASIPL